MRAITLLVLCAAAALIQPAEPYREAIALGRVPDPQVYESFAKGYDLGARPPVSRAEVVTEFRRAVMIVHEQAAQGNFSISGPELATSMAPWKGIVTIVADVLLNPLNTYSKAPNYELYVATGPATPPLSSKGLKRTAIAPVGLVSGPGVAVAGVTLEATFPASAIKAAPHPSVVITDDAANVIWQAQLDLSRYR